MQVEGAPIRLVKKARRPRAHGAARHLGPYSGPTALAHVDGRTKEGRLMRRLRDDLVAHVGGNPSPTQRALIDRAVALSLRLALMDRHTFAAGPVMSEKDGREYLAWSNALERTMRRLGLAPRDGLKLPRLADYMQARGT